MLATHLAAGLVTVFVHLGLLLVLARLLVKRMESGVWRERIWRFALGGAIVSASFQTSLAAGPFVLPLLPSSEQGAVISNVSLERRALNAGVEPAASVARELSSAVATRGATTSRTPVTIDRISWGLVLVWLCGAGTILVRQSRARRSFLAGLKHVPLDTVSTLDTGIRALQRNVWNEHRVRLSTSHALSSPVVISPTEICLPELLIGEFSSRELEATLGHELAHIRRQDLLWLRVYCWFEACFFFQPLVRQATSALRAEAELACDDWAVEQGAGRLELARSLAKIAAWSPGAPVGLSAMLGADSELVERVRRLTSERTNNNSNRRNWVSATTLAVGLGILACGGPTVGIDEKTNTSPGQGPLVLEVCANGELHVEKLVFQPPADWAEFKRELIQREPKTTGRTPQAPSELPVVIRAETGVGFDRIQILLQELAEIGVFQISLKFGSQPAISASLPTDNHVMEEVVEADMADGEAIALSKDAFEVLLRLDSDAPTGIRYSVWGSKVKTLADVGEYARSSNARNKLRSVTVDARTGILYKHVIALMDTLRTGSGNPELPIYFVGAYDSDWSDR